MRTADNIRKIDDLGRVVLPMGIRRNLNISGRDSLEIFVDSDKILIKKYESTCVLCGSRKDLMEFRGKSICRNCRSGFIDN